MLLFRPDQEAPLHSFMHEYSCASWMRVQCSAWCCCSGQAVEGEGGRAARHSGAAIPTGRRRGCRGQAFRGGGGPGGGPGRTWHPCVAGAASWHDCIPGRAPPRNPRKVCPYLPGREKPLDGCRAVPGWLLSHAMTGHWQVCWLCICMHKLCCASHISASIGS